MHEDQQRERDFHIGHEHWRIPFDFSNIQMSVWFALIPETFYIWQNMRVLQMDNRQEYTFFKSNGIKQTQVMLISSIVILVLYLGIVLSNITVVLDSAIHHNWANFEGMTFYSLLVIQSLTLNQYCKSKFNDFETSISKFRDKIRKSY